MFLCILSNLHTIWDNIYALQLMERTNWEPRWLEGRKRGVDRSKMSQKIWEHAHLQALNRKNHPEH